MRGIKKIFGKATTTIVCGLIALAQTAPPALAQAEPAVRLQAIEETANQIKAEVVAEDMSDLYGAEIRLAFDPAVLAVHDANFEKAKLSPPNRRPDRPAEHRTRRSQPER